MCVGTNFEGPGVKRFLVVENVLMIVIDHKVKIGEYKFKPQHNVSFFVSRFRQFTKTSTAPTSKHFNASNS